MEWNGIKINLKKHITYYFDLKVNYKRKYKTIITFILTSRMTKSLKVKKLIQCFFFFSILH